MKPFCCYRRRTSRGLHLLVEERAYAQWERNAERYM